MFYLLVRPKLEKNLASRTLQTQHLKKTKETRRQREEGAKKPKEKKKKYLWDRGS